MEVLSTFSGVGCGGGPYDEESKYIDVTDVEIKNLTGELLRIDDLLDFPSEEIAGSIWKETFQVTQICAADISTTGAQPINIHSPSKSKSHSRPVTIDSDDTQFVNIGVPYDDIAELEWLSNFIEDTFSLDQDYKFLSTLGLRNILANADRSSGTTHQQTFGSDSVLDRTAYSSADKRCVEGPPSPPAPARRKRSRTTGIRIPTSSTITASAASEISSTSSDSASLFYSSSPETEPALVDQSFSIKRFKHEGKRRHVNFSFIKCMHCGIQKTPQWRAGPMGPKSLCNACGVRYKSGRLLPEYRPAASPQYIPEKHSNSHKRVLQMRLQKESKMLDRQIHD